MVKHRGITIWLTGLPCAGKTTIANELSKILREKGYKVEVLDGDVIREYISKGLGFSREDRFENIKRVSFVAKLLTRNDVITIVAVISPYREMREMAKKMIGEENFLEVFVNAPLEVCRKRDVKGMYKKAEQGLIKNFTGIDDPYEPPENPDVQCDTHIETIEEIVSKILSALKRKNIIEI